MASNHTHPDSGWYTDELCSVARETAQLDVSRRSILAATAAGLLGGLTTGTGTVGAQSEDYHLKTRPTLYTEEMRQNARENVQQYDWAASQRDNAVGSADGYLEQYAGDADDPDLDALWSLITSQKIPRDGGYSAERATLGGFSDPGTDRLWKIETSVDNPHDDGNFVVPTNDFEAYRQSGLDDEGKFDPDLADDSLLVNEEHPEMGEGWGVDDGYGWVDEDDDLGEGAGHRWDFVGYYNHWFIWRPGGVRRIMVALGDAYLLTGERKYAVAGLVMLDRIADVYPEMWIGDYMQKDGFWNNHGGRQTGRIIGGSWETNLVRNLMPAYDAFFPALDDDQVAEEVTTFLDGKTEEFPGLDGKETVGAVRENIEENFIHEMLPAAKNSDLVPSRGQRPTVALSARIADDVRENGYTREALTWLFQPGGERFTGGTWNEEPENWNTTGGELLTPVVDQCDRDGYWHEAAPLYNRIQMSSIRQVAETLKGYDGFEGADLYQHPKMQQALGINSDLLLLDSLFPEIGDTHAYHGGTWMSSSGVQDGYEVTGSTRYAQLWHYLNGYSTAGIRGSIFDADPEGLDQEVQAIIDAEGPLDLPSQNLAGYGFAALRDGENPTIDIGGEITYDTSELFVDASTDVDDSFEDAIQLEATEEGESWTFEFDVREAGEYELGIDALFGPSTYGIYELYVNGEHVDTVDFYADGSGRETLSYVLDLPEGSNEMRWVNVGKNEESDSYKMALYSLSLEETGISRITYDTSELFVDASTEVDDSFDEAIQLEANEEGEWWTFEFDVPEANEYQVDIEALFVSSYGIYELYVNDELVDTVDFMADGSGRETISYVLELPQGTNEMRWVNVGKNEESSNYKMALYTLSLDEPRAGELENLKRVLWMYYGRSGFDGGGTAHGHQDALNVGLAANEMELARDLGYPEKTGSHPKRQFFTENTISHNTVVVDERAQKEHWVGVPRHFDGEDERVNLIDVEAPHAYPVTDEYRRTTAMITVDDEHSYAVDFFRVRGGDDHWFSFHGTKADVSTEGLDLVAQDGGTLAGEDVPLKDDAYNQEMYDNGIERSPGSGFNYFDNVERDGDPSEKVVVEWDVEDHFGVRDDNAEGVNMRLTSFGDFDEVALADGYPSKSSSGATPEPSIKWAFLQRSGSDVASDFVSTIEHYDGDRVVESVEEVPVKGGDADAVKVELTTGRTDYVVCSLDDEGTVIVDDTFEFKGFFGVYSVEDGEPEYAYVHDGTKIELVDGPALIDTDHGEAKGWVEGFTKEMSLENELSTRIQAGRKEVDRHAGFVYVDNDNSNPWRSQPDPEEPIHQRSQRGLGNGAYPIEGIEHGDGDRVTIDVGEKTFLRDFVDPDQLEEGGYHTIIDEDDDLRIPLTSTWSAE